MKQKLEDKLKSGIYVIENTINHKKYVGKAKCIYKRIKQHVTYLNTKSKDENPHLINAWHKYGRSNFTYNVLEYIESDLNDIDVILSERELYWMNKLNSLDTNKGYNLRYDSGGKCFVSEETRIKCSQSQIKRFESEEERLKISMASKQAHIDNPESYENAKIKLAYANRLYRIAQCDKLTGSIIKIYEIIKDIIDENPDYYAQAIKGCCQGTKNSYRGFR